MSLIPRHIPSGARASRLLTGKAPPLESRYVTEDVPFGLLTYSSLGDMLGVPTPVTKSMITIFEAMLGKELGTFWKEGRTVEELGIAGLSVDQINRLVNEGDV